ncbi:MAG: histidinol-phosphate transaminase [Lachnospiraceae bacterium]|nr:histidinol-phosphate transaminase [Lachnospiraceae bacterium]
MDHAMHGGDIYRNVITHDFSVNLNPFGMPEAVKDALRASVEHWDRYPDSECAALRDALARHHQIRSEEILCGNGAADLIFQLVQTLRPRRALLAVPTFSEYGQALQGVGCEIRQYLLREEEGFHVPMDELIGCLTQDTELVFFCNPNNPTGIPVRNSELEKLADACRSTGTLLVLDECFGAFLEEPEQYSMLGTIEKYPNMLILKAFTKSYAMAGVRLGYAVCANTQLLAQMRRLRQPWSVSVPAQEAGIAALKQTSYLQQTRALLKEQRPNLTCGLKRLGLTVYDSEANYVLFQVPWERGVTAGNSGEKKSLYEGCREQKLLIRDCSNYAGLGPGFYRVCIRTPEENRYLLEQFKQIISLTKGAWQR